VFCEEHLLIERYPEYREHVKHTSRMIPPIF